jgi:transaldolase
MSRKAGLIMPSVNQLKVKIFADGADKAGMVEMYKNPNVKGFTTNPTLMRKAGVTDYEAAAKEIVTAIPDRSISFEVFADDFAEMERQARRITTWGKHVSVKIPITNIKKESAIPLVRKLSQDGIALNVTAIFTLEQVQDVVDAVKGGAPCYVSVFAGRIADSGICSSHGRVGQTPKGRPEHGAHLGKPARAAQHLPG